MTDLTQSSEGHSAPAPAHHSAALAPLLEERTIAPPAARPGRFALPPSEPPPAWAAAVFPGGLVEEGGGVWAPAGVRWNLEGMARANADAQPRLGGGPDVRQHFEALLRQALESGLELPQAPLVLDLRSADGLRSALPWLSLLPQAQVIASDPASLPLATLVGRAIKEGHGARLAAVTAEADAVPVAAGSIDIVSGVGCLHQLPDPDRVIALAATALRPGGYAVFLAPFDGHGILRAAYERIRAEAPLWPDAPLLPGVEAAMDEFAQDIAARTLPDPADPSFGKLQDKWLFARESLEGAARGAGFSRVRFLPHNDHETLYRDFALIQLRSVLGPQASLPPWAEAVLDSFDQALRPPVKRLLMLEGTAIFTR
jgi:SAM-dependent methyltransferase